MRFLEQGDPDQTFNDGQGTTVAYGFGNSSGDRVCIMSAHNNWTNNDILIAGTNEDNKLYIARLDFAGQTQGPFGNSGILVIPFYHPSYKASCVSGLYSNQKGEVYVCGSGELDGKIAAFIVKLTEVGVYDHTFGEEGCHFITLLNAGGISARSNGEIVVGLANSATDSELFYCRANVNFDVVRVQVKVRGLYSPRFSSIGPDDSYFLAGRVMIGGSERSFASKFDAQNQLHQRFGQSGVTVIEFENGVSVSEGLAVSKSGKVAILGNIDNVGFTLAVLDRNGMLDSSFSGDGRRIIRLPGISLTGRAVVYDEHDRLIVCGDTNGGEDVFLMRFSPQGNIGENFGSNNLQRYPGLVLFRNIEIPSGSSATRKVYVAKALAIDAEHKLVLTGTCYE